MKRHKILLLFTGGTIAMIRDEKNGTLVPAKTPDELLSLVPQLKDHFEIAVEFIANIDSTNIQVSHWQKLTQTIYDRYSDFDGFVVTHGTDTMAYSASAVSYALAGLNKPIVFTGALLPPDHINTDARHNLLHAFQVAASDLAEVVIVYGSQIIRGNRSLKLSKMDFNPYWSPIYPELGSILETVQISASAQKKSAEKKNLLLQNHFNDNVIVVTLSPGLNPIFVDALIEKSVSGIVLAAFGTGNVPTTQRSLIPSIKKAVEKNIPVIIASQCLGGVASSVMYAVGHAALEAGAISAHDMTLEAATTKLMWALGKTTDLPHVRQIIEKNIAGEMSE